MAAAAPEAPSKSTCIFCNIVNKLENTEILYEDEEVCVFRDIRPASRFHILTIPKRHIEDVKSLTAADKDLVEKLLTVAKEMLTKNGLSEDVARFGYHWPPFRSVKHLHLHTIAPENEMGFFAKMMFLKDSYWFVSTTLEPWGPGALRLYRDLAGHLIDATGDQKAGQYFAQRISIAMQRGKAASFLGTLP